MSNARHNNQRKHWYLSKNAKRFEDGPLSLTDLVYGPNTVDFGGTVITNVTICGDVKGNIIGNITANIIGNVTGDVIGNVTGDLCGNVYTDYIFDKNGDGEIHIEGNIVSNLIGTVFGTVVGLATLAAYPLLTDKTIFTKKIYGPICYFPWDNFRYNTYTFGTVIIYAVINSTKTIDIRIRDVNNVVTLGTSNITTTGIHKINIINPTSDTYILIEGRYNGSNGENPYVYGITLEYYS